MIEITFSPLFQKEREATRFKFGDKVKLQCQELPLGLQDVVGQVSRVYLNDGAEAYGVVIKGCVLLANMWELSAT